jgi:hypothetical protein
MPPTLRLEQLEDRCVPTVLSLGPAEVGVFRNGTWILDTNNNHQFDAGDTTFVFGLPGDIPITGDWNGDGHTAVGVFRNVNGVGQFILDSNDNHVFDASDQVFFFGLGTDTPVSGDWDGSGRDKVGIFRNVNGAGEWVLDTNGHQHFDSTSAVFFFGGGNDKPIVGDWNGDGRGKVGVFLNKGGGQFVLDTNGDRVLDAGDQVFFYGIGTDTPVSGDWTGDFRVKVGVVRDNGHGSLVWSLDANDNQTFDAGDQVFTFGLNTDKPVTGNWNG